MVTTYSSPPPITTGWYGWGAPVARTAGCGRWRQTAPGGRPGPGTAAVAAASAAGAPPPAARGPRPAGEKRGRWRGPGDRGQAGSPFSSNKLAGHRPTGCVFHCWERFCVTRMQFFKGLGRQAVLFFFHRPCGHSHLLIVCCPTRWFGCTGIRVDMAIIFI